MIEEFSDVITRQNIMKIREIVITSDRQDRLVFTPTDRGDFLLKSFLERNRVASMERRLDRLVWNSRFFPNLGAFPWKLFRYALPVDSRIQSRGINLVSRCICCSNH